MDRRFAKRSDESNIGTFHRLVWLVVAVSSLAASCSTGVHDPPNESVRSVQQNLVISTLTVRLTRLYIGRFADMGLYDAGVGFFGVPSPVNIWDCPASSGLGFGSFVSPPEGQSGDSICDAPNTIGSGADIAQLAPFPDRTVYKLITPSNATTIPVRIAFIHATLSTLNFNWLFNVDASTGAVTFDAIQGNAHAEQHGTASCAKSNDDWMLCWEVEAGALGPGLPPLPPFPWDVVDADPAVSGPHDPNGLRFNARWNWQTIPVPEPFAFDLCGPGCTRQPTTENVPRQGIFGSIPITCDADVLPIPGANSKGHLNWEIVTYQGQLRWSDHSFDDDYNFLLDTPVTNGFPSGITGTNDFVSSIGHFNVKLEFKASETVDRFQGTPYWRGFLGQVESDSPDPQQVNGNDAIVLGLLGVDREHSSSSEVHPVFALAVHSNTDLANDTWDIFARNFGNEGFCSSRMEYIVSGAGRDAPLDLTLQLPRPKSVADDVVPQVIAGDFFGTRTLTVQLTRLHIGRFPDMGLYRAGVGFFAPATGVEIWDCPRSSSVGFGSFVSPPEGQSGDTICDAPGTIGSGADIAQLAPFEGRTVYSMTIPGDVSQIPVDIIFQHPTLGGLNFDWRFNVDAATGATTFNPIQNNAHAETHGTASCARGTDDWMLCWEVHVGAGALASVPTDVSAGANQPTFVTFHLPAAPHSGEGASRSGELRLNWTGSPAPQPAPAPFAQAAQAAPQASPPDSEEELGNALEQLTPAQRAIYSALLPPRRVPLQNVLLTTNVRTGAPPIPATKLGLDFVDDPVQEQNRLGALKAFCGALGAQSPTGRGSCSDFPPGTILTNTGTLGSTGWFTSPVTVTLTAVDAGGNGIDHVEYSFDNQNWIRYAGPFALTDGLIDVFYRSLDRVGRMEATQQRSFRIDTILPQSNLTIGSPQFLVGPPVVISSATPLTLTATDSGSGVASLAFRFFLQGSSAPAFTVQSGSTTQFHVTGPDGVYQVDTAANDVAGNSVKLSRAIRLSNSADLAVVSITAQNPPALLLVGTPATLTIRTTFTNLGLVNPVDAVLTRSGIGTSNVTVGPTLVTQTEPGLGLGEQRVRDQSYTISCLARSSDAIRFTSRVMLAANGPIVDPVSANDIAELVFTAACKVPWKSGVLYRVADDVVFDGLEYRCRQQHTAQVGWEPPKTYALWERINTGGAWAPQVIYKTGDEVAFQGHRYRAIQGHQSQPGWEPPNVPSLWQRLN